LSPYTISFAFFGRAAKHVRVTSRERQNVEEAQFFSPEKSRREINAPNCVGFKNAAPQIKAFEYESEQTC
jgi:hypothetical protein